MGGKRNNKNKQQRQAGDAEQATEETVPMAATPAPAAPPQEAEDATETTRLVSSNKPRYDGSASVEVDAPHAGCSPAGDAEMDDSKKREMKAIRVAAVFCFVFMCVEVVGGYMANSLAILTDAAHLLTDIGAFILALYTLHATTKGSDHVYSYGYHRAEVVGTLASVFTIWALVGAIVVESFSRLRSIYQCASLTSRELREANVTCEAVKTETMIVIGVLGLVVNLACAAILSWGGSHGHSHGLGGGHGHSHGGDDHGHSHGADDHGHSHGGDDHGHSHGGDDHGHSHGGHDEDPAGEIHGHSHAHGVATGESKKGGSMALNAAFLHALGDSVQSVGVILAGIFIYYMNRHAYGHATVPKSMYNLADPCCSLLFSVVTLYTTKGLIWQILAILMETTPESVDYAKLRQDLSEIPDVENVHDLHVWSLTANQAALSVHLVAAEQKEVLRRAQDVCSKHGIDHTTIQVDPPEVGAENCITRMGCHNC